MTVKPSGHLLTPGASLLGSKFAMWLQIAVFAGLLVASSALWAGRDHVVAMLHELTVTADGDRAGREREERTALVIAADVDERENRLKLTAVGTVRARRSVMIYPEVAGDVTAFHTQAGQRISKGQKILELDARKAQLAVDVAETRLQDAKRLLERAETLENRNVGSLAKVDDAAMAVRRAELERDQAREILGDHTIVAPFDGVVGIGNIEVGDRVEPTTALVSLDERFELLVEFPLPEEFFSRVTSGQPISGQTPSFPNRTFTGHIERIDSRIDPVSRSVKVRAAFENGEDLLRPGMSFTITLDLPGKTYPSVPELALQWDQGENFVWRITEGKAEKVAVKLVTRDSGHILVDGDLNAGERIVVEGVQRLRSGTKVRLGNEPAPGKTAPARDGARS